MRDLLDQVLAAHGGLARWRDAFAPGLLQRLRAYRRETPDGPMLDQLMVSNDLTDIQFS